MSLSYRLVLGLILCFEIHCEGGCNYWYVRVPISSTACNLQEGGTAHFTCYVRGICNYTFNVQWYKRINHNISELISGGLHGKYNIHGPNLVNLSNSVNYCYIHTGLNVYNFNSSDNGHYWCQITHSNNCLLQPSPHDYIAVSEDMANISQSCTFSHLLNPLKCAEDSVSSISSDMRYIPQNSSATVIMTKPAITISHSTHYYNLTTTTITLHDSNGFDREDNMIWLYGVITTVFLFIIVVLVLGLVVMSLKYRAQQNKRNMARETTYVHYDNIEMDEHKETQTEEISEPYYSEIVHNNNTDSRYIMKPNVCYNTLQMSTVTSTTKSGHDESAMYSSYKPSVETLTVSDATAKQNQSPDYDDIR